jgi:endonuclease/exonuclease/phosphatase family metal-dependent hydrolase
MKLYPIVFVFFAMIGQAQTMRIATFNLRYDNPKDSGNLWVDRLPRIVDLIRYHDFDIIGTQEGLQHQLNQLNDELHGYAFYGIGRDDGKSAGEHSAIFFKTSRFSIKDSGDFWLSTTPLQPGKGWDANINRICSWVKLRDFETEKIFYVFNVHYDHQGKIARLESSRLLMQKIPEITGGIPFVLTGDFNGNQQSEWYRMLNNSENMKDAYGLAKTRYALNGSFNGFKSVGISNDIIDHIFLSKEFIAGKYAIHTDTYFGKYPSDHFPVSVTIEGN